MRIASAVPPTVSIPRKSVRYEQLIICPHCSHGETRSGDSIYLLHAMSGQEEADFNSDPLDIEHSIPGAAA